MKCIWKETIICKISLFKVHPTHIFPHFCTLGNLPYSIITLVPFNYFLDNEKLRAERELGFQGCSWYCTVAVSDVFATSPAQKSSEKSAVTGSLIVFVLPRGANVCNYGDPAVSHGIHHCIVAHLKLDLPPSGRLSFSLICCRVIIN